MATLKDLRDTGITFQGGIEVVAPNGTLLYGKETCDFQSPSTILAYLMEKPVDSIYASCDEGYDPFFRVYLSDEVMEDDDFIQSFRSLGKRI